MVNQVVLQEGAVKLTFSQSGTVGLDIEVDQAGSKVTIKSMVTGQTEINLLKTGLNHFRNGYFRSFLSCWHQERVVTEVTGLQLDPTAAALAKFLDKLVQFGVATDHEDQETLPDRVGFYLALLAGQVVPDNVQISDYDPAYQEEDVLLLQVQLTVKATEVHALAEAIVAWAGG